MDAITLTSLKFGILKDFTKPHPGNAKGREVHLMGTGRSKLPAGGFTVFLYVVDEASWWLAGKVLPADLKPIGDDSFEATAYLKFYNKAREKGELKESTSTSAPDSHALDSGPTRGTGELTVSTSTSDPTTPPQPPPKPSVLMAAKSFAGFSLFFPVT